MPLMKKSPNVVYWRGNSLYLNITNRCPNNCYFCFRNFKNGINGFNLKLQKDPSTNKVVRELQKVIHRRNWSEAVFCGFGEPLERLDCVLEITRWVKKYSRTVARSDTNGQGYLLNGGREVAKELKDAGLVRVSVSLNTDSKGTYNEVCRPRFENAFEMALEFVEKAKKEGLDTEITAVTIPEADISKVRELADRMGVRLRVREYIPCFW